MVRYRALGFRGLDLEAPGCSGNTAWGLGPLWLVLEDRSYPGISHKDSRDKPEAKLVLS